MRVDATARRFREFSGRVLRANRLDARLQRQPRFMQVLNGLQALFHWNRGIHSLAHAHSVIRTVDANLLHLTRAFHRNVIIVRKQGHFGVEH